MAGVMGGGCGGVARWMMRLVVDAVSKYVAVKTCTARAVSGDGDSAGSGNAGNAADVAVCMRVVMLGR